MTKLSDRERVLRALRRGPVRPEDFLLPTCDGGKPTTRVAARVCDLRKSGYAIDSGVQDNGCAVYRLTAEPDLARDDRDAPPVAGPTDPGIAGSDWEAAVGQLFNPDMVAA